MNGPRCGKCGRRYGPSSFSKLRVVGRQETLPSEPPLVIRACGCGSTISTAAAGSPSNRWRSPSSTPPSADVARRIEHDLRQPLAALLLAIDCLSLELGDAAPVAALADVSDAADAVQRMIADCADVFGTSAPQLDARRASTVRVGDVLRAVVERARRLVRSTAQPLMLQIDDERLDVCGDREMLRRMFSNLIDLSLVQSRGSTGVFISARRSDDGTVQVHFAPGGVRRRTETSGWVYESGASDPATMPRAALSLTACRNIARAHGGQLGTAEGELGREYLVLLGPRAARASSAP